MEKRSELDKFVYYCPDGLSGGSQTTEKPTDAQVMLRENIHRGLPAPFLIGNISMRKLPDAKYVTGVMIFVPNTINPKDLDDIKTSAVASHIGNSFLDSLDRSFNYGVRILYPEIAGVKLMDSKTKADENGLWYSTVQYQQGTKILVSSGIGSTQEQAYLGAVCEAYQSACIKLGGE